MVGRSVFWGLSLWIAAAVPLASASPLQSLTRRLGRAHARPLNAAEAFPYCPDFSGSWVGTCAYDGRPDDAKETVSIAQTDCTSISIDGYDFAFGGTDTVSQKTADGDSVNANVESFWGAGRKTFRQIFQFAIHRLNGEFNGSVQSIDAYSLQDNVLIKTTSAGTFITQNNPNGFRTPPVECSYHRQSRD